MKKLLMTLSLLAIANVGFAAVEKVNTNIVQVMSDGTRFGGCMANLADSPSDTGLDCTTNWVSFSCSGDFNPKDVANRNFDMAQIALMTGARVALRVDDTLKHNGRCFVRQIQLFPSQ